MNMKEYESAINPAMESYDSDDIVLGDIDHDENTYASEMGVLLEALDMLPEAEFTAAMESMTDDEIYAIYNAALEAGSGGGGNPKPKHDASDAALGASDNYREKIAGDNGGLVGKLSNYLAKKGESSISSGMMNKIAQTGSDAGKKDLLRLATLTKNGFSKDEALRSLQADQKTRAREIRSEMWKTGVRNPFAYLAANKKLNKAAADAYKDAADAKIKSNLQKAADKKAKEDFKKKNPEEAASIKLKEDRSKEDKKFSEFRKGLSKEAQQRFDNFDTRKIDRARDDMLSRRQKDYEDLKSLGYSEKAAKRKSGLEKTERELNNMASDQQFKAGVKAAAGAFKDTVNRDTQTLQSAAKTVAKGTKTAAHKLSNAAKSAWKELTASTGSEYGFDCYNGDDIDVTLESVYESGNTIYTPTLEEAYYAARIIASMDDDEIDEMMSELSATECTDLITSLNYFNDIIDADIQRDTRLEFESAIENAFSEHPIDYAMEDAPAPVAQPVKTDEEKKSNPPAPASAPNNNGAVAQKPSIGTRIKNFITGNGSNAGFKQRVATAFKSARDKINTWWNGKPQATTNTAPTASNNNNTESNNNNKSDTAANGSDGG